MSVAVISVANIQFCNSGCQGFEVNKRYDVIGMVQFTFIFRFIFINCNRTITNNLNSTIMKTRNWLWLLLSAMVCTLYACSESEEKVDFEGVGIKDVTHTLCKNVDSRSLYDFQVDYKVEKGILHVTILNFHINCGSKGADAKIDLNEEENEIILTPYDLGPYNANCVCPIDISVTIANLQKGKTYKCTIEHLGISFSFKCKNGAKGTAYRN